MPELPEVERAARLLERVAVGRTIQRIERRAKHQLLHLDDGSTLHVHFRMAGDWSFGVVGESLPLHARAVLELEDGARISLVDTRALSTIALHRSGEAEQHLPLLGPEPLDPGFDAAVLGASLARRRGAIKPALIDQSVVAGIGNIYAVESLWHARIDPRVRASALGPRRRARLVEAIRVVVGEALKNPARYSDPDARTRFAVYDREGERCDRCGSRIRRIVQAGRSTYFCPGCQR